MVGDEIIHQGKAVSPNQFAQSFARTTRNAWTDLYIRRPEDKQFNMAHRLRLALARQAAATPPAQPAPRPRDTTQGEAWDLPERRKFRFRLEDVAFD